MVSMSVIEGETHNLDESQDIDRNGSWTNLECGDMVDEVEDREMGVHRLRCGVM